MSPGPGATSRERSTRWAVGGMVGLLAAIAVALVTTAWLSYRRAQEASLDLAYRQGVGLVRAARVKVIANRGQLDAAVLRELLEEQQAQGLRYIASFDKRGDITAAAGQSVDASPLRLASVLEGLDSPDGLTVTWVKGRARAWVVRVRNGAPPPAGLGEPLPPPRLEGPPPEPGAPPPRPDDPAPRPDDPPPRPDDPPPRPDDPAPGLVDPSSPLPPPRPQPPWPPWANQAPPRSGPGAPLPPPGRLPPLLPPLPFDLGGVVVEFEPTLGDQLRNEARRTLAIGVASACLLLVTALVLAAWVRRRDRVLTRAAHERRLAALGEMSAVLAHELRNPLASLKGHAQLLLESLHDRDRDRRKVERVVSEAVRLETLTQDLLEFVRTGRIERRSCAPAEVLRAAVAATPAGHRAAPGELSETRETSAPGETMIGNISLDTSGAPARWSLDPERISQVLTNLLQNAVQAAPDGQVLATVRHEGGRLIYRVRDHGPGLPDGDPDAIFEPFHTTRVRGVGLGLAVARRLVELHHGTLTARSCDDGGAEFTVAIPPA